MIIISGYRPDPHGVGRMLAYLKQTSQTLHEKRVRFVFSPSKITTKKAIKKVQPLRLLAALLEMRREKRQLWGVLEDVELLESSEPVVIIHTHMLGCEWCEQFMKKRVGPTWIYLMDCSFFCVRSYNHIPGEPGACLRCLGGQWHEAKQQNCRPFPLASTRAQELTVNLMKWAAEGKVKFLAQNRIQAELAREHFGDHVEINVVGLWARDFAIADSVPSKSNDARNGDFDVVYHGSFAPAKGFLWTLKLAEHCPELKFLFPCKYIEVLKMGIPIPRNSRFQSIRWETGLSCATRRAKLVLVPSLWSAPIEGSLIKSVFLSRAVGVVDEATTYAAELPDGLVLRLPPDIEKAAAILTQSLKSGWQPEEEIRSEWIDTFYENKRLLEKMFSTCEET